MYFNLSDLFFVLVIFQFLFISLFLFTHRKGKRVSNRLLGAFFLSICLNLADNFLTLKKAYISSPFWIGWGICLPLMFGPLLYLYTQSLLFKNFTFSRKKWIHLLPFILFFVVTELHYLSLTREFQLTIIHNLELRKIPSYFYWASGFIFFQFFIYISASYRLINRYKKIANDTFSDQQRTNISWLSSTIFFFTFCMILVTLNGFTGLTPWAKYYYFFFTLIILLVFIFINRVLLKVLQKPEIFAVMNEPESLRGNKIPKYAGSLLEVGESKTILERLQLHMMTRKPYLEPELSLDELASQIAIRPKVLSQVINELLKQNFFDFINRYRIEEAKRLLTNPADKKITILEVLYQVGFNSKSSFNTLFKKQTGLTPTEYKRQHMQ